MATKDVKKGAKLTVALDGDKLGQIVGAMVALIVMALCFYYQKVDGYTAATRVGWAFVLSYASVFFLVRVVLRTTLFEFIEHRNAEWAARRAKQRTSSVQVDEQAPEISEDEPPSDEVI